MAFSQWVVLKSLQEETATTCAELARLMSHDTGATTRLIDQLERRGLRHPHPQRRDRRVVHLKLLPAGRAMAKALAPRLMNFWNRMLADFSAAEAATLVDLLARLGDRMDDEPVGALTVRKRVTPKRGPRR